MSSESFGSRAVRILDELRFNSSERPDLAIAFATALAVLEVARQTAAVAKHTEASTAHLAAIRKRMWTPGGF